MGKEVSIPREKASAMIDTGFYANSYGLYYHVAGVLD